MKHINQAKLTLQLKVIETLCISVALESQHPNSNNVTCMTQTVAKTHLCLCIRHITLQFCAANCICWTNLWWRRPTSGQGRRDLASTGFVWSWRAAVALPSYQWDTMRLPLLDSTIRLPDNDTQSQWDLHNHTHTRTAMQQKPGHSGYCPKITGVGELFFLINHLSFKQGKVSVP